MFAAVLMETLKQRQADLIYKIYVTDALRQIEKNGGEYCEQRYYDIARPLTEQNAEADDISGDEIAADIINRAGLVVT